MSHHAFPKPDDIIKVTLNNPLHLHLHSQWLANPYHELQRSDSIMIPQKNGWRELSISTRMEMVMAHWHWIREVVTTLDKAKADWYWRTNKMTQQNSRWRRRQWEPPWWGLGIGMGHTVGKISHTTPAPVQTAPIWKLQPQYWFFTTVSFGALWVQCHVD